MNKTNRITTKGTSFDVYLAMPAEESLNPEKRKLYSLTFEALEALKDKPISAVTPYDTKNFMGFFDDKNTRMPISRLVIADINDSDTFLQQTIHYAIAHRKKPILAFYNSENNARPNDETVRNIAFHSSLAGLLGIRYANPQDAANRIAEQAQHYLSSRGK